MLWIITEDKITAGTADCPSRVGKVSTHNARRCTEWRNASEEQRDVLRAAWAAECETEFHLFDDDGEHYYSGVCLKLDEQDEESAFEPLNWAMNDAGCTRMDTRKKGETKWNVL